YPITVVSIFVNPKQFGPGEDYEKYPRTLDEDLKKLYEIKCPDHHLIILAPQSPSEIFPQDIELELSVPRLESILCGKTRPGHFQGVLSVVYQLFNLITPTTAYFGKKDFQQLMIIEKMVKDLSLDIEIKPVNLVRDEQGLALSSRNQYLSEKEKELSLNLYQSLSQTKEILIKDNPNKESVQKLLNEQIKKSPELQYDYLEVRNAKDLSEFNHFDQNIVILAAAKVGSTRLIDNLEVSLSEREGESHA
ncbi:MAG: pantoate--beta-alanine ligase, partial [Bacteriovoracaceae bacterium]